MSLVTVTQVSKSYGPLEVLREVSFLVPPAERTGLIGPNGSGKTTLLRLILGEERPDSGRVTLPPGVRVAMLAQEPLLGDARTVVEAARRPTAELQALWAQLTLLEQAHLDDAEHLQQYDLLHHRYQDLGGYDCENRAPEVLAGLGLPEEKWDRPIAVLSGGERTRLALAQILVWQPDLLLLDEPTNHIDWQASEWLQEYLQRYPGAALIVSHDRYFLDRVAGQIVALEGGGCRTYRGNYTAYLQRRAQEREQAEAVWKRLQADIERQEAIVQRMRSHRKFDTMHSREKVLDRLRQEQAERPRAPRRGLTIAARQAARTGREVLTARDLEHGYESRTLFSGIRFTLERGERLAILGPNGSGKTTMLRVLAGDLEPRRGSVELGHQVEPAYFAQDHSSLDPEATVWETLWSTGLLNLPETTQALHQFLFAGDALQRRVSDLSGGERTRLALCRLLAARPNLLLLDEPTNHLDLESREAVEAALCRCEGAVVLVSHDRYLLESVATRLLEIRPAGHRLFDGGYRRYREVYPAAVPAAPLSRKAPAAPAPRTRPVPPAKRLAQVEREIAALEERQKSVSAALSAWDPDQDAAALTEEYRLLSARLEALYSSWEELAELAAQSGSSG